MDLLPTLLVLLAALLHATWNVIVKQDSDRLLFLTLMSVASALLWLPLLPFVNPPGGAAFVYVIVSAVLHAFYKLFLAGGYRHGDLNQVYPVARGAAPLLVGLLAYLVADETLDPLQIAAVLLIGGGIMSLILHRGLPVRREAKALGYAAATAVMIAGYTVVDGLGVRVAASVLGYAVYLFVFEGVFFTAIAIAMRGRAVIAYSRVAWKPVAASALFSSAAYALVLWALTLADMALVSALRETSVLFGALMGTFLLREALGAWRISSAAVILTGLVLLHG